MLGGIDCGRRRRGECISGNKRKRSYTSGEVDFNEFLTYSIVLLTFFIRKKGHI